MSYREDEREYELKIEKMRPSRVLVLLGLLIAAAMGVVLIKQVSASDEPTLLDVAARCVDVTPACRADVSRVLQDDVVSTPGDIRCFTAVELAIRFNVTTKFVLRCCKPMKGWPEYEAFCMRADELGLGR